MKKYNLTANFILYLGTLQPRKNLPVLIEAFALIKEQVGELYLVIAGGRSYNYDNEIDETIRRLDIKNSLKFTGFVAEEDKIGLMKHAKLFCFPSLYEGFGIPILEVFGCGTPVIASDIPAHHEVAGNAAVFFNPSDANELSEKILKVINDNNLRQFMITAGFRQVEKFSWRNSAETLLKIYQRMC